MANFFARFIKWLPLGLAITLMCGLLYVTVQQVYRQGANDPQVQIVQEIVRGLETGEDPKSLDSAQKLELADSVSPFVIIYGEDGKVVASSVTFEGGDALVPEGVLHETDDGDQNRITWAPRTDVREAIVVDHFVSKDGKTKGYVVVGRSLAEVEQRVTMLTQKVVIGWAVTLVATFLATLLVPGGGSLLSGKKS